VLPDRRVDLVDTAAEPVTCASWAKPAGAQESSLNLLAGARVPLVDGASALALVGGGSGTVADRVAVGAGSGYFVQTVGQEPGSPTAGSRFWLSDTGVRYGIDGDESVTALGLGADPLPAPWSVLALFAAGPTLSRGDALTARDTVGSDTNTARLEKP
jgi:type VII secretion protein EccB